MSEPFDYNAPTGAQHQYVKDICRKFKITEFAIHSYVADRFGKQYDHLTKQEVSDLLSEMTSWEHAPAELQRAMGQLDLLGMGS